MRIFSSFHDIIYAVFFKFSTSFPSCLSLTFQYIFVSIQQVSYVQEIHTICLWILNS